MMNQLNYGKIEELKQELVNQKQYYEEALEARFNQMEQFEEEAAQLRL